MSLAGMIGRGLVFVADWLRSVAGRIFAALGMGAGRVADFIGSVARNVFSGFQSVASALWRMGVHMAERVKVLGLFAASGFVYYYNGFERLTGTNDKVTLPIPGKNELIKSVPQLEPSGIKSLLGHLFLWCVGIAPLALLVFAFIAFVKHSVISLGRNIAAWLHKACLGWDNIQRFFDIEDDTRPGAQRIFGLPGVFMGGLLGFVLTATLLSLRTLVSSLKALGYLLVFGALFGWDFNEQAEARVKAESIIGKPEPWQLAVPGYVVGAPLFLLAFAAGALVRTSFESARIFKFRVLYAFSWSVYIPEDRLVNNLIEMYLNHCWPYSWPGDRLGVGLGLFVRLVLGGVIDSLLSGVDMFVPLANVVYDQEKFKVPVFRVYQAGGEGQAQALAERPAWRRHFLGLPGRVLGVGLGLGYLMVGGLARMAWQSGYMAFLLCREGLLSGAKLKQPSWPENELIEDNRKARYLSRPGVLLGLVLGGIFAGVAGALAVLWNNLVATFLQAKQHAQALAAEINRGFGATPSAEGQAAEWQPEIPAYGWIGTWVGYLTMGVVRGLVLVGFHSGASARTVFVIMTQPLLFGLPEGAPENSHDQKLNDENVQKQWQQWRDADQRAASRRYGFGFAGGALGVVVALLANSALFLAQVARHSGRALLDQLAYSIEKGLEEQPGASPEQLTKLPADKVAEISAQNTRWPSRSGWNLPGLALGWLLGQAVRCVILLGRLSLHNQRVALCGIEWAINSVLVELTTIDIRSALPRHYKNLSRAHIIKAPVGVLLGFVLGLGAVCVLLPLRILYATGVNTWGVVSAWVLAAGRVISDFVDTDVVQAEIAAPLLAEGEGQDPIPEATEPGAAPLHAEAEINAQGEARPTWRSKAFGVFGYPLGAVLGAIVVMLLNLGQVLWHGGVLTAYYMGLAVIWTALPEEWQEKWQEKWPIDKRNPWAIYGFGLLSGGLFIGSALGALGWMVVTAVCVVVFSLGQWGLTSYRLMRGALGPFKSRLPAVNNKLLERFQLSRRNFPGFLAGLACGVIVSAGIIWPLRLVAESLVIATKVMWHAAKQAWRFQRTGSREEGQISQSIRQDLIEPVKKIERDKKSNFAWPGLLLGTVLSTFVIVPVTLLCRGLWHSATVSWDRGLLLARWLIDKCRAEPKRVKWSGAKPVWALPGYVIGGLVGGTVGALFLSGRLLWTNGESFFRMLAYMGSLALVYPSKSFEELFNVFLAYAPKSFAELFNVSKDERGALIWCLGIPGAMLAVPLGLVLFMVIGAVRVAANTGISLAYLVGIQLNIALAKSQFSVLSKVDRGKLDQCLGILGWGLAALFLPIAGLLWCGRQVVQRPVDVLGVLLFPLMLAYGLLIVLPYKAICRWVLGRNDFVILEKLRVRGAEGNNSTEVKGLVKLFRRLNDSGHFKSADHDSKETSKEQPLNQSYKHFLRMTFTLNLSTPEETLLHSLVKAVEAGCSGDELKREYDSWVANELSDIRKGHFKTADQGDAEVKKFNEVTAAIEQALFSQVH